MVADHGVTPYDGDLDDYRRSVLSARSTDARDRAEDKTKSERPRSEPKRSRRAAPRQRMTEAEAEIERITGIIAKIDAALALPDLFQRDPKQAAQLGRARTAAAAALQRAEDEWLIASSEAEEGVN